MDKFYITTSIPYVNSKLHLGHVLEFCQADCIARHKRAEGRNVFFLSGADEHGAKIMRAAEQEGKEVKKFVDENARNVKDILEKLNISNDDFIRTSDTARHFPSAQKLWKKLDEAGDIYKAVYKGLYCVGCEAFITEKDLVGGKCEDHDEEPETIEEENYFFRLSKYTTEIKTKIESGELKIFPETRKNEILSLLNEGLEDISFSRPAKDISWGVPVPRDPTQTMYVWCDALSNYISALGYAENSEKFNNFWPTDLHVIGKDILRFHAAIWPGMLLSARLPLPKAIFVHGFIFARGERMSKSLGTGVDPLDLIKKFGADALRHYLLVGTPIFNDSDFSEERFLEVYNSNLANALGNLVQRTAKMALNYFSGVIEKPDENILASVPVTARAGLLGEKTSTGKESGIEIWTISYFANNRLLPKYKELMDNFELNKAAVLLWTFIAQMDKYIDEYKPFKLIKEDEVKTKAVLWHIFYGIANLAACLPPFMPETADKIFNIIGANKKEPKENWKTFTVKEELLIPLFPKK